MGQNTPAQVALSPSGGVTFLKVDASGALQTVSVESAASAVSLSASSGDVAATAAVANLTGNATTTPYISGLTVNGAGATAESVVDVTVTGLQGGNLTVPLLIPAGATTIVNPLTLQFNPPLKGAAVNGTISVSAPSFGTGNLHAAVNAWGFRE